MNWVRWLAAPHWMLAFFAFAIASGLVAVHRPEWITPVWVVPLSIFAVSLLAAIATNPRFRRDGALLALHLGLLGLVILVVMARLSYLEGAVTLTQGTVFNGRLQMERRGPLHPGQVEKLRFANEGFTENFTPRARWKDTYNRIRWWDSAGNTHTAEIGDDHPLILGGYRIYTTFNRGFSPLFSWQPDGGGEQMGTVQLRAGRDMAMSASWTLPNGMETWVMLELAESDDLAPGQRRHNLGAGSLAHKLIVRSGEHREEIKLGQSLRLPGGSLTYLSLESWMGYRIVYDWTMYWMISAIVVVVGSMVFHYLKTFFPRRSEEMPQ